jgi:hypothetical protein
MTIKASGVWYALVTDAIFRSRRASSEIAVPISGLRLCHHNHQPSILLFFEYRL